MKYKLLLLGTVLLFIFSCKKISSPADKMSIEEFNHYEKNSIKNDSSSYQLEQLTCNGSDYQYTACFTSDKTTAIFFEELSKKKTVSISESNMNEDFLLPEGFGSLGYQVFLFKKPLGEKLVLLDQFLEYGHEYYLYKITNKTIEHIGNQTIENGDEHFETVFRIYEKPDGILLQIGDNQTVNFDKKVQPQKHKKNIERNRKTIPSRFQGQYSCTVTMDHTTNGNSIMEYNFKISDSNIELKLNTYHAPINCDGIYQASINENILNLYYSGSDKYCLKDPNNPRYKIKEENNELFILGVGGEVTVNKWQPLKRINIKEK